MISKYLLKQNKNIQKNKNGKKDERMMNTQPTYRILLFWLAVRRKFWLLPLNKKL